LYFVLNDNVIWYKFLIIFLILVIVYKNINDKSLPTPSVHNACFNISITCE
jgi:hypothetical protein